MTHETGPREQLIAVLIEELLQDIRSSGCTISECSHAISHVQEFLLKAALRPLEKYTCPTCPNPGDLTLEQISKIENAIKKVLSDAT